MKGMKPTHLPVRSILFGTFFLCLAAADARADFVYLRPDSVDLRKFPRPPKADSPRDREDLEGVRDVQKTLTRSECERAIDEAGASAMSFFGMSHAVLSREEIALVEGLYAEIGNDASEFISPLKKGFARPRPFQRDSRIRLCVPKVTGFSYPSGHSTLGRVAARTLALLFPKREKALLARGDEVGFDRVIGAVHHPLDIEAGRLLGDKIFEALRKSPNFMHRIEQIRAQLPRVSTRR